MLHPRGDLLGSEQEAMSPPLADGLFTTEPPGKLLRFFFLQHFNFTFKKIVIVLRIFFKTTREVPVFLSYATTQDSSAQSCTPSQYITV